MILLKEDLDNLRTAIALLQTIFKNAVMSEIEEEKDREFSKKLNCYLNKTEKKGVLKFNNKELNKMPKEIKEKLNNNLGRHIRQKANGVYEIRMNYNGIQCYGCSKSFKEAERQFFESLKAALVPPATSDEAIAESEKDKQIIYTVQEYSKHYLEVFKKPNICEQSFRNYSSEINNHIAKFFEGVLMSDVTASACQQLLNGVLAAGKGRLAEDLNNLLNWICEAAVADGILIKNPMSSVQIPEHYREAGKQIPVQIMESYLANPPKNRNDYCLQLIAYSGVRPCELKTIVIDGNFMTVKNAKQRKNRPPTFRRIPIHPALLPYVNEIKESLDINTDVLAQAFKRRFPSEYHLYELRHTFTSRIQECGANKSWVDYATNHVSRQNTTDKVYTHWSDAFQLSEMEKLNYKV